MNTRNNKFQIDNFSCFFFLNPKLTCLLLVLVDFSKLKGSFLLLLLFLFLRLNGLIVYAVVVVVVWHLVSTVLKDYS